MKVKSKKQIKNNLHSEYFVYGEHLKSVELLKSEAKHFYNYYIKNNDPNKTLSDFIYEFAKTRTWWKEERGCGSNAGNLKALEYAFLYIYFYSKPFLKMLADDPNRKRQKIYRKYARQQEKKGKPVSLEQLKQIDYCSDKRDKILPKEILNNQDYKTWIEKNKHIFITLNKAWGFKTCKGGDCFRQLPEKDRREYCNDVCKTKERSRRWRSKNPTKKLRSNLKYLTFLTKENDI